MLTYVAFLYASLFKIWELSKTKTKAQSAADNEQIMDVDKDIATDSALTNNSEFAQDVTSIETMFSDHVPDDQPSRKKIKGVSFGGGED